MVTIRCTIGYCLCCDHGSVQESLSTNMLHAVLCVLLEYIISASVLLVLVRFKRGSGSDFEPLPTSEGKLFLPGQEIFNHPC